MHDAMREISIEFELSQEQEDKLVDEIGVLFDEYDISYTSGALHKIIQKWASEKGRVINTLAKHPNWNPEKFQIQFIEDYKREVNLEQLKKFFKWIKLEYAKKAEQKLRQYPWGYKETMEIMNRLERILNTPSNPREFYSYKGKSLMEYKKDYRKFEEYFEKNFSNVRLLTGSDYVDRPIHQDDYKILYNVDQLNNTLAEYFNNNVGEDNIHLCPTELANKINELFPDLAKGGQKISKILTKLGKQLELTGIVDIRDNSFFNNNGIFVERKKDFGWNYQQAMMGDAINPLSIKRFTIISANPVDYLTMSFGHKWQSCHDISKGKRYHGGYNGEYCAGTVSYMLDPSSVIFYTVDENYDGDEFELQDKMQRAVMAFDHDKFYEGRVYPDGRDGGDQGYAPQFRQIMQKVLAECLNVDNLWVVKKGNSECSSVMENLYGKAYADWECCSDSVMSYLKINNELNEEYIEINAPAICVECGYENDNEEVLLCSDCDNKNICDRCGDRINENNIIHIGDNTYCCLDCAEEDGYRWCVDVQEYQDYNDCYYDDYEEEYFYYTDDMVEVDEYTFRNTENAEDFGYTYCDNIEEWKRKSDCYIDDYTGEYFYPTDDMVITKDDHCYVDCYNAQNDGYVKNANGDWVPEDEMEVAS